MTVIGALQLSRRPAAAFAIIGLFWGTFAAHIPVFKARIGVDDGVFGLLLLGTGMGLMSAMWLAPRMDRLLGRVGLPAAAFMFIAAFVLPALATAPRGFLLALILIGVVSGLTDVIMNTRVSELEGSSGKPLMNANHGVFSAAYALAALASGWAREAGVGPEIVFSVLALVCLPLAIMSRQEVAPAVEAGPAAGDSLLLPVILCGAVVLIAFMTEATVETWSALHIERTLGGGAAQGAAGPAVLGLTMAAGRFSGQAISARFSEFTVILWGVGLAAAGVVGVAVAQGPLVAYLGFGAMGLGVSVIGPIGLALVGRLVPPQKRVAAISRVAVIGFSGFFVAPMVMGQLSDAFGLRVAFAAFGILLLAIVPLLGMIRKLPQ